MERLVRKAIQATAALKKTPEQVPWQLDEPWHQPYYAWDIEGEAWEFRKPSQSLRSHTKNHSGNSLSSIALYSWNIDFMLPYAEARMHAALSHLDELTTCLPSTTAVVINLQECIPSDLITISQQAWVRDRFYITDLDSSSWGSGLYGTTTLVDRRLQVDACFRVHFSASSMERDVLFVDVKIPGGTGYGKIRLGNTHLESLALDPPLRPTQMHLAATYMLEDGLAGSIIAGDFNAIQPFDITLHSDNGLKDAYLELGSKEGVEEGFTWGQQALPALRNQFGCSRMDKTYFCGKGFQLSNFERFGVGIKVSGDGREKQKEGLLALGFEEAWCTDHLGVKAIFDLALESHI